MSDDIGGPQMQGKATVGTDDSAYSGQAVYTRRMLRVYDLIVFGINGPILWRCSRKKLIEHYGKHVSARHLDVGVGTGYLLDRCQFPAEPRLTLMDLNANSLVVTARRLKRYSPETHQANVLESWDLPIETFDSVAMSNTLHCVPGTMKEKVTAFEQAHLALAAGGTLFGSTVLGEGVEHTRRSRGALKRLNQRRVFCNLHDSLEDLEAGLERTFDSYEVEVQGVVALFAARRGLQDGDERDERAREQVVGTP